MEKVALLYSLNEQTRKSKRGIIEKLIKIISKLIPASSTAVELSK